MRSQQWLFHCVLSLSLPLLSACLFHVYSRRDRFANKLIKLQPSLPKAQQRAVLGKPDAVKTPGKGTLKLPPGSVIVLRIALPKTYQGYCASLSIHLPQSKQSEATYRVWVGPTPTGPWLMIGRAITSKTFDIDELPFSRAQYVRLQVEPQSGLSLWLDAVHIHVHLPGWLPLAQRRLPPNTSPVVRKRTRERALIALKRGVQAYENQRFKEALQQLRAARPLLPKNPQLYYTLASTYYALEQYFQAIRTFTYALTLRPPTAEQLEEFGQSYLALRQLKRAFKFFHRCNLKAPLYPRCYYHKIEVASLLPRLKKPLVELYKDQYLIVKYRTQVRYRHWSKQRLFAHIYRRGYAPYIERHPTRFARRYHIEWFLFLKRLFPNQTQELLEDSLSLLRRTAKEHPAFRWRAAMLRAQLNALAGHIQRSHKLLHALTTQRHGSQHQRAQAYLLQIQLYLKRNQKKRALRLYQHAQKQLSSKAARTLLQRKLQPFLLDLPSLKQRSIPQQRSPKQRAR